MRYVGRFVLGFIFLGGTTIAAAQPFSLAVKAVRPFGDDRGVLILAEEGFAFEARETAHTRRWPFDAIRYVRIATPRQIVVQTYETTKQLLVVPALRTYTFEAVEGSVTPEFVAALLERFSRPVLTTVLPAVGDPLWRGLAWHDRHRSGHDGVLELHDEGLVFRAGASNANRDWRYQDVVSVLRLSAYRIEVAVRESNDVKPYVFELKSDLPEPVFETLWRQLHPAADWGR